MRQNNPARIRTMLMANRFRCLNCNIGMDEFIFIELEDIEFRAVIKPASSAKHPLAPSSRNKFMGRGACLNRVHELSVCKRMEAMCPHCGKTRSVKLPMRKDSIGVEFGILGH